jgi:LmbE family N-acetylglucosaminyl deacetylase
MNIILSPHFDDAVLSLGGLMSKEGSDTLVATFFAGTPQMPLVRKWDTKCGFTDSTQAMHVRDEENRRSLNSFGVTDGRIRNYAHIDAQYRLVKGASVPPEPELDAAIEKEITALLQEFATEPLKVFIPGFGMHDDHAVVRRAALATLRVLTLRDNSLFLLSQELPYAMKILGKEPPRTLWDFITHKDPEPINYALLERAAMQGVGAISKSIIPLTSADMEKKLAGVKFYSSQIAPIGKNLLKTLERFSATQARDLSISAPYCEVVYTFTKDTRS